MTEEPRPGVQSKASTKFIEMKQSAQERLREKRPSCGIAVAELWGLCLA
jgi:hypothetical protein